MEREQRMRDRKEEKAWLRSSELSKLLSGKCSRSCLPVCHCAAQAGQAWARPGQPPRPGRERRGAAQHMMAARRKAKKDEGRLLPPRSSTTAGRFKILFLTPDTLTMLKSGFKKV